MASPSPASGTGPGHLRRFAQDLCPWTGDVRPRRVRRSTRNVANGTAEEAIWVAAPQDLRPGTGPTGPPLAVGPGPDGPPGTAGWTTGRIVSAVIGAVLAVCALSALGAGGAALWADATQRHDGYVHLGTASYATAGHALASDTIKVYGGLGWLAPLIGQIRIQVTGTGRANGEFAGVAPANAASRYLSGVSYTTVSSYDGQRIGINHPGSRAPRPPRSMPIWAAQASGIPSATLLWTVRDGDWTVIVMNADGSAGVAVRADLAASLPALGWLATEFLTGGTVLALIAFACIMVPVRLAVTSRVTVGPGSRALR